jgi:hypothetical protein
MATNKEETQKPAETAALVPAGEAKLPAISVGRADGGLVPRNFDELYRLARIMAASGMMPKDITKVEQVFVAVQMGMELGLSAMASVQSIAVINGRPSIWGDAALGLVLASRLCESVNEEPLYADSGSIVGFRCTAKRKDAPSPVVREFTEADARRAGLWGKTGPWTQYPQRMLQMRARSWALRDAFPDVLKGLMVREEAGDIEVLGVAPSVEEKTVELKDRLRAIKDRSAEDAKSVEATEDGGSDPAHPRPDGSYGTPRGPEVGTPEGPAGPGSLPFDEEA